MIDARICTSISVYIKIAKWTVALNEKIRKKGVQEKKVHRIEIRHLQKVRSM